MSTSRKSSQHEQNMLEQCQDRSYHQVWDVRSGGGGKIEQLREWCYGTERSSDVSNFNLTEYQEPST